MFNKLKRDKNKKGFTIVEIVVVLAMMVIISMVVAPNFKTFGNKADNDRIESELTIIHSVALNMGDEKESDLYQYFNGTKKNELYKEIQSVTNYEMDKIEDFKYGVDSKNRLVVYYTDGDTYYWDGESLTTSTPTGLTAVTSANVTKIIALIKTGGYVPDVTSKYFVFNGGGEYGDTIEGLTPLGQEYFESDLIIPEKDDNGTVIVKIDNDAFRGEGIERVYIPDTVVTIDSGAFSNNGPSKNSDSIETKLAAYTNGTLGYNGYEGEWKVLGGQWVKTVRTVNVSPAGITPYVSKNVDYQALGLSKLHQVTVRTRLSNSLDTFSGVQVKGDNVIQTLPASKVSFIDDLAGAVAIKIEAAKSSLVWPANDGALFREYGRMTTFAGKENDTKYVSGVLNDTVVPAGTTKYYEEKDFNSIVEKYTTWKGTLGRDSIINGGTPAGTTPVSGISHAAGPGAQPTSWTYSTGTAPNIYSGVVSRQSVKSGTPANTKYVTNQAAKAYKESGVEGYSGSLTTYIHSGYVADSRYVTGISNGSAAGSQPASFTYSEGSGLNTYSGTITSYAVKDGLPEASRWETNKSSSWYNDGTYRGTLSEYQHPTNHPAQTKTATDSVNKYNKQNFKYKYTYSSSWVTKTYKRYDTWTYASFFKTGDAWPWVGPYNKVRQPTVNGTGSIGGLTWQYDYNGNAVGSSYKNRTDLQNNKSYHYETVTTWGVWGGTVYTHTGGYWESTGWEYFASTQYPASIAKTDGDYSGTLNKSGTDVFVRVYSDTRTSPYDGKTGYVMEEWRQNYSGTLTKPAYTTYATRYQGTVVRPSTERFLYRGTIYRPDTAVWRWQGNVSKGDTRTWYYQGTLSKNDTRLWNYKGTVSGDTREWKPYFYYQIILE